MLPLEVFAAFILASVAYRPFLTINDSETNVRWPPPALELICEVVRS